jgi:hypothetical protein
MLDTFKQLTGNQFDAALCMLGFCVEQCPDVLWECRIANLRFCQVAFHALFFADYYLGQSDEHSFRRQRFHLDNSQIFRDYEELEDRVQVLLYDKDAIRAYVRHCRNKAAQAIAAETAESLRAPCGFARKALSRAELYVLNIRHIQHHVAQLSMRLRLDAQESTPWVASGWRTWPNTT